MTYFRESATLLAQEDAEGRSYQERASCWLRTKSFLTLITVEPALSMILFGIGLESVFITKLWVEKTCYFHFNYTKTICENIDSGKYPEEQNNVQRITNQYNVYSHILLQLPAVVVVFLLGSWGDKRGRRLPIVIPFLGYILTPLGIAAISYLQLPPEYLLLCYVPLAFTGGLMGVYSGVYPYLSMVSNGRARTSRISVIAVVVITSATLGKATSIVIYSHGGYVAVFGSQAALAAAAIIYSILRLEDTPGNEADRDIPIKGVLHVLSPSSLQEVIMVAFKKREAGKNRCIIGNLCIMFLLVFVAGSYNYNFLYTRKKFGWDYKAFWNFTVIDTLLSAVGVLVITPILSYICRVEDSMLGFIGGISLLLSNTLKATAPEPWVMYLASGVGMCINQVTVASRGSLSKLVSKGELGAVFAVLAAGEAIIPMAAAATYTALYNTTIEFFPGMIFILCVCLSLFICVLYVWMLTRSRQQVEHEECPQDNSIGV